MSKRVKVREFKSYKEIQDVDGFEERNPLVGEEYDYLIGHYDLKPMLKCCFQKKNGNLCKKDHSFGFIVRLKNKSATIIGNDCASDNFDEAAQITKDRASYKNERERLSKLDVIENLRHEKETIISNIDSYMQKLSDIMLYLKTLEANLGLDEYQKLQRMYKTGNAQIQVKIRKEKNGSSENSIETLGSFSGLSIFDESAFKRIHKQRRELLSIFQRINDVNEDASKTELSKITSSLKVYDNLSRECEKLISDHEKFSNGTLSLLCFLSAKRENRYKTARFVLGALKRPSSKEKGKQFLQELDKQVKEKYKAVDLVTGI